MPESPEDRVLRASARGRSSSQRIPANPAAETGIAAVEQDRHTAPPAAAENATSGAADPHPAQPVR